MNFALLRTARATIVFAPDGIGGPSSGGSSPNAQLPANRDTSGMGGDTPHTMPTQADIAQLAQQYWEEEGRPEGRATEHWNRAEQALRQHAGLQ